MDNTKIAFLFHGEPKNALNDDKPLMFLPNDIERMEEVLRENWIIANKGSHKLERTYFDHIPEVYKNGDVEEVFFYFTGHGIDHEDNILDAYSLKLAPDNSSTENLKVSDLITYIFDRINPNSLTLVLDTCYSGQAQITQNRHIQILTSSNHMQRSYEDKGLQCSKFTHYFCQAIKNRCEEESLEKITLNDIKSYIEGKISKQSIVHKYNDFGFGHNTIAYTKEVNALKKFLLSTFTTVQSFREAVLPYLENDVINLEKIQKTDDLSELFYLLLQEERCLYCLLQKLNCYHPYLKKLDIIDSGNFCQKLEESVQKSRKIKAVTLIIRLGTDKGISNCYVSGYLENSVGEYFNAPGLEKLDFTGNYKETIGLYLSEILENIENKESLLELKFILPNQLFHIDFYNLKIQTQFRQKSIKEDFNISIKLFFRFESYNKRGFFERWEVNSERFDKYKSCKIIDHVYNIDEKNKINFFGTNFNSPDKKTEKKIEYLSVVSKYPILQDDKLMEMVEFGVPNTICPHKEDSEKEITIDWQETKVSDIKQTVFNDIRTKEKIFFICDRYDETVALQRAIKEKKIKDLS